MSQEDKFKETHTIFGAKGQGKTTLAFSYQGEILCFTYDNKSQRIKKYMFGDDPRIHIISAVALYDRTPDNMIPTSKKAYDEIIKDLEEWTDKVDWVMHDGLEKAHEICEMIMRGAYKLTPFQGFKEMSYWKYRRVLMGSLHNKSLQCARKGVIYTTFIKYEEEIEDGNVTQKLPTPRYFDAVEEETDVLLRAFVKDDPKTGLRSYNVKVVSSKIPKYEDGKIIPYTLKRK